MKRKRFCKSKSKLLLRFSFLFLLLSANVLIAQTKQAIDVVKDETGQPVQGVNVRGSSFGSTTATDGTFSINVAENVTLVFSTHISTY
jgi:hypothetical protein